MISDHNGSDRNNDGADSVKVLNDLMGSSDPFGFSIDVSDISSDNPAVLGSSDPVLDGPFGTATGTIIRDGTTATLHPADNPAVRGEVFRTGSSASGTTGAAVVTSSYGAGRVAYWGDSSPIDDGTGQSGNTLYDGWNDPAGTDAALALNATAWLAGGGSSGGGGGGGAPLANGGFESGSAPWTLSGAAVTSARAHSGTLVAVTRRHELVDRVRDAVRPGAVVGHAALVDLRHHAGDRHDRLRHARGEARHDDGADAVEHGDQRRVVRDVGLARALRRADGAAVVHGDERHEVADHVLGRRRHRRLSATSQGSYRAPIRRNLDG